MRVIFFSNMCSNKMFDVINKIKTKDKLNPSQKFFDLLFRGLVQNSNISELIQITSIPVAQSNCKKRWFGQKKEKLNEKYTIYYPGFINITLIKNILVMLNSLKMAKRILKSNKIRKETYIICDPLVYDVSLSGLLISKLLKIKSVGILTDVPKYMAEIEKSKITVILKIKTLIKRKVIDMLMLGFDGYVFLTKDMNSLCNKYNKPYIILEGLVDKHEPITFNSFNKYRKKSKVVIYAGGLHKKFGIETLINAAKLLVDNNIEIHLYGEGDYIEELIQENSLPSNVRYFGLVNVEEIIQKEAIADLLINTRPTNEEYTKYSFPSKTMEYMSTGTPVLTTKLPGIPKDYYPYLNFIQNETSEGIANAIQDVLNRHEEVLRKQGDEARNFVINKKNNVIQANMLYEMLNKL